VRFTPIERELFGNTQPNRFLGVVRGAFLAYAADRETRESASSGGVVTALSLHLRSAGAVNGVLCYTRHESEPWRGWGRIARTEAEIREAAQSRYHLSPMNTALASLDGLEGEYAYIGIPCQVHGLWKLRGAGWSPKASLGPVIGIYCGNNLYFEATRVILTKLGVKRLEDIEELSYREGAWPGNFSVKTCDGRLRSIPKHEFNQVIPFYINKRCLFCIDLTNELTDLSVGDGWAREGSREGGYSIVLTRTERGEQLLRQAADDGVVHLEQINIEAAERMHAHAFDLKKVGAFLRMASWRRIGYAVPSYDRPVPEVGAGRRVGEFFVSLQFIACSSWIGRCAMRMLPVGALGRFFRFLRTTWIRLSQK
jgi:coenzyme F420 hydrogenase subunit beta